MSAKRASSSAATGSEGVDRRDQIENVLDPLLGHVALAPRVYAVEKAVEIRSEEVGARRDPRVVERTPLARDIPAFPTREAQRASLDQVDRASPEEPEGDLQGVPIDAHRERGPGYLGLTEDIDELVDASNGSQSGAAGERGVADPALDAALEAQRAAARASKGACALSLCDVGAA